MAEIVDMGGIHSPTCDLDEDCSCGIAYWRDGWAQVNNPRWPGRGLATELGARAYGRYTGEPPGRWPQTLIDHERMLDEFEEHVDG